MNAICYLDVILCLIHLAGTPILFLEVRDYLRFLVLYALFTTGIVGCIWLTFRFIPRDYDGSGIGTGLILGAICFFPVYFTTPFIIFGRTIYHLKELAQQRAQATSQSAALSHQEQPITDVLGIVIHSIIILITLIPIIFILSEICSRIFPPPRQLRDTSQPVDWPRDTIKRTLLTVLRNISVTEIVWQYWTYEISQPKDLLFTRPISYHLLTLALVILRPVLKYPRSRQNSIATMEGGKRAQLVQKAMDGPAVHPQIEAADLSPGNPIILSASSRPFRDPLMNRKFATWLEYDQPHKLGPKLVVFTFSSASTRSIQLPYFADTYGNSDNVRFYLLNSKAVLLGTTLLATIDLDTGTIKTTSLEAEADFFSRHPERILVCERWMVVARKFHDADIRIMNLNDFGLRSIVVPRHSIQGLTKHSLVITGSMAGYASIDLETLTETPLSSNDIWWFNQKKDTVDDDLMVTPKGQALRTKNTVNGVIHEARTGYAHSGYLVSGNSLFWTPSEGDNLLLRTELDTGNTERVLNAPGGLNGFDYAINDRFILKSRQQNLQFDPENYETYPILLELVPIQTSPHSTITVIVEQRTAS